MDVESGRHLSLSMSRLAYDFLLPFIPSIVIFVTSLLPKVLLLLWSFASTAAHGWPPF
jgi:hypothetical protein